MEIFYILIKNCENNPPTHFLLSMDVNYIVANALALKSVLLNYDTQQGLISKMMNLVKIWYDRNKHEHKYHFSFLREIKMPQNLCSHCRHYQKRENK
jgi:hypothetical protein